MEFRRRLQDSLTIAYRKHPEKTVAISEEGEFTYADLYRESQNIARHLRQTGFRKGDRGAVFIENSWNILTSVYGILYAGGTFLVINHLTKQDKISYILEDCQAAVLLSDSMVSKHFIPAVKDQYDRLDQPYLKQLIVAGAAVEDFGAAPIYRFDDIHESNNRDEEHIEAQTLSVDLAALIYTSGSTGDPKGVMMTHASMVFTSDSLVEYLRLDENSRIMCFLPMAFDYGLYQILMTVRLGSTIIIGKSFAFPSLVFEQVRESNSTVFPAVPTVFSTLIAMYEKTPFTLPSVTRVTNTAAALPAEYIDTLQAIFPNALIYKMYGLTECKRVSYLEPELIDTHARSVGKAIPGTEVFLLDENHEPVEAGQEGVLYVRGAHLMQGYWNKPEQTAQMLKTDIVPGQTVLCAQDKFVMDENGFLYFRGRTDDIIKTRGEKVSPIEVENVLHSMTGVAEAAVIGVADPVEGQYIKAFVSLDDGCSLHPRQIRQYCISKLENFMVPREVVVMDALPKTDSNKITKKELR